MKISFGPFSGMRPRVSKRFLGETEAQEALNCDLTAGSLRAMKEGLAVAVLAMAGPVQTIHLWGEGTAQRWLQFAGDVDVVRGAVAGDLTGKTYFADGVLPRVTNSDLVDVGGNDEYPESSYPLGVPAPAAALVAAASGSGGSGDDRGVQYVWTYVRTWADGTTDEGPPSPVSTEIQAMDGETINISGLGGAVTGRADITHKRLYRVNAGETGADFQFVKEVAVATTATTDAVLDADLEDILPSEGWDAPPDGLTGLVRHPGNFLAGVAGNELCFSEVGQFHAWPDGYRLTMDFPPCGLGLFGSTLVALGPANPVLVTGGEPGAMNSEALPDLAPCLSKRGIVSTDLGVIWPCPQGLYLVGAEGPGLLSRSYLTRTAFADYHPDTITAVWCDGQYIAFCTDGTTGFGFTYAPSEAGAVFGKLGFFATALHVDPRTGTLFYVEQDPVTGLNYVKEWQGGDTRLVATWRSPERVLPGAVSFAAARVDADFLPSLDEDGQAAYEAERLALMEANEALFLAGPTDIYAACSGAPCSMFACSGDNRDVVAASYVEPEGVTVRIFGEEGALRSQFTRVRPGVQALPAGFKDRYGCVELSGKREVWVLDIATSAEELA